MDYLIVCTVALVVSAMTLFSGFGLGTLLMPAFALFFPVPIAVAATAVVHLSNNIFKLILVGRMANWKVVARFGIPAALAAIVGALLLTYMAGSRPLVEYSLGESVHQITILKLVISVLIIGFAILELTPRFEKMAFHPRYIPLGGALSGFFGGLSGHQGALRSAFLIRSGLPKEAFVGTNVVTAVVVDVTRLAVYGVAFFGASFSAVSKSGSSAWNLVIAGTLAAFVGSFVGARLVKKVTMRSIQVLVGVLLLLVGIAFGVGLI